MTPGIELRIRAERIIRADRLEAGRDVSHLRFEQQYHAAMQAYANAVRRIADLANKAFP